MFKIIACIVYILRDFVISHKFETTTSSHLRGSTLTWVQFCILQASCHDASFSAAAVPF